MRNIRHILDKYELHPTRYQVKGKVTFVDTDRGQFAMKEMEHDQEEIWNYLRSRNFLYYPEIIRERVDHGCRDMGYFCHWTCSWSRTILAGNQCDVVDFVGVGRFRIYFPKD